MAKNKQPYLIEDRVVPIETFCKNYNIVMNNQFIMILR